MVSYSRTEIQKLFESLPQDLKQALLSEETANHIREICQRQGLAEKEIPQVARLVGDILMGLLPPEDFPGSLERGLGTPEEKAEAISREVNRFILFPVKGSLAEFYGGIKFAPGGRIESQETKPDSTAREPTPDIYREPID